MEPQAMCCTACFDAIVSRFGKDIAKFWQDLCHHFVVMGGNYWIRETRVPFAIHKLRALEQFGVISTCDGKDVGLRINGHRIVTKDEEKLDVFCIENEHKKKWEADGYV